LLRVNALPLAALPCRRHGEELSEAMDFHNQRAHMTTTQQIKPRTGSESCNAMSEKKTQTGEFWATAPRAIGVGLVGYFGRYSRMARGQTVAVLAEARAGFFMVAPVDSRRRVCGASRAVKRSNLALCQRDFFVIA
jgi:hypothetical protein